jgi:hypothetical protein
MALMTDSLFTAPAPKVSFAGQFTARDAFGRSWLGFSDAQCIAQSLDDWVTVVAIAQPLVGWALFVDVLQPLLGCSFDIDSSCATPAYAQPKWHFSPQGAH